MSWHLQVHTVNLLHFYKNGTSTDVATATLPVALDATRAGVLKAEELAAGLELA